MSSDYSPMSGPPIIHRDELGALRRPPAPDHSVSPHLAATSELMVAARQDAAGPLPEGWTDTYEGGRWRADLHLDEPLTDLEAELGLVQTLTSPTRAGLLAAISAQDAVRHPTRKTDHDDDQ